MPHGQQSIRVLLGTGRPRRPDITSGNHDATNITEQSQCRNSRSCWEQVAWAWPATMLAPHGAPNPEANGAVIDPTQFINTSDTVRVVLVLDESGSMNSESPKRIERLKVAAKNFISLAESGTEVGIVSYATNAAVASGRTEIAIAPLGANRTTWNNAIDGLTPSTRTNIGAGLQKARDLIVAAGGVTANTYIVLMSDGLNNEPAPQANADTDLDAKIALLLADGIPVYVTCTGSDIGLASQCSEIGTGTGGHYVDSADAAQLPQAFADFHERIVAHEPVSSSSGDLAKVTPKIPAATVFIEKGARSASFILQWSHPNAQADLMLKDPNGNTHHTQTMTMGRFLRLNDPAPGNWQFFIQSRGTASPFVARAYVHNPANHLAVDMRYPSIVPYGDIYVYAYPKNQGLAVTSDQPIVAQVIRPDGGLDNLELHDRGRDATGHGDDVPGDGVFTGIYKATA
ncbi:MAG: VWA domain-containing protein [Desulfobulbus sp.]|nr:VWA domain-containing protein [Desulfobulbus sp.]